MAENFDLLGDPIPANHGGRGRPQHIATVKNRNKVMLLLAMGWSNPRIAASLGITAPTFRKNYFRELKVRDEALPRLQAKLVEAIAAKALAGNVPATRELQKLLHGAMLEAGLHHFTGTDQAKPAPTAKPERLGKKEAAAEAAALAGGEGTEWGDDLLPTLN